MYQRTCMIVRETIITSNLRSSFPTIQKRKQHSRSTTVTIPTKGAPPDVFALGRSLAHSQPAQDGVPCTTEFSSWHMIVSKLAHDRGSKSAHGVASESAHDKASKSTHDGGAGKRQSNTFQGSCQNHTEGIHASSAYPSLTKSKDRSARQLPEIRPFKTARVAKPFHYKMDKY